MKRLHYAVIVCKLALILVRGIFDVDSSVLSVIVDRSVAMPVFRMQHAVVRIAYKSVNFRLDSID